MPPRGSVHKGSSLATKAVALLLTSLILLPSNPNVVSAAMRIGGRMGDIHPSGNAAPTSKAGGSENTGHPTNDAPALIPRGPMGPLTGTGIGIDPLSPAPNAPAPALPQGQQLVGRPDSSAPVSILQAASPSPLSNSLENRVALLFTAMRSGHEALVHHALSTVRPNTSARNIQSTPDTQTFLHLLRGIGAQDENKALFDGTLKILKPVGDIVAWTWTSTNGKTYLLASNRGNHHSGARLENGSYLRLEGGGAHLSEIISAAKPARARFELPTAASNWLSSNWRILAAQGVLLSLTILSGSALLAVFAVGSMLLIRELASNPSAIGAHLSKTTFAEFAAILAQGQPKIREASSKWLHADWETWTKRIVCLAIVFFFLLQVPQIATNFAALAAHHTAAIKILPWIGYSTGIVANSNLWAYQIGMGRHAVAFVQGAGVVTSAIVLAQIFMAGFMPLPAALFMAGFVVASVIMNVLRWTGLLPDKTLERASASGKKQTTAIPNGRWKMWQRFSTLLSLFALPFGLSVTFNLMDSHPLAVLITSTILAAVGTAAMILDEKRPKDARKKGAHSFWEKLGWWLSTLLFVFIPFAELMNNYQNPSIVHGHALGTRVLSLLGNGCEVAGAILAGDLIWFVGNAWSMIVGGWGVMYSMYTLAPDSVDPLKIPIWPHHSLSIPFRAVFWADTVLLPSYLAWLVHQAAKAHKKSYWDVLSFIPGISLLRRVTDTLLASALFVAIALAWLLTKLKSLAFPPQPIMTEMRGKNKKRASAAQNRQKHGKRPTARGRRLAPTQGIANQSL